MGPSKHIFGCGTEEYHLPNSGIAILLASYKYDFRVSLYSINLPGDSSCPILIKCGREYIGSVSD